MKDDMWRVELRDWELVGLESYKFRLEKAELRLKYLLEDAAKVTDRTYNLINIVVPIMAVLLGFVIKNHIEDTRNSYFETVSIILLIGFAICAVFLYRLIDVRDTWNMGSEPIDHVKTEYLEMEHLDEVETLKYQYLSELEMVQYKITQNDNSNIKRMNTFSLCLRYVIAASVGSIAIVIFFLLSS